MLYSFMVIVENIAREMEMHITQKKINKHQSMYFGLGSKRSKYYWKRCNIKITVLPNLDFQIRSCQFALHYFFESETSLHSFLRNLSECTKVTM